MQKLEDTRVKERILALLEKIEDEQFLESIYWYIDRKVVRDAAAKQNPVETEKP